MLSCKGLVGLSSDLLDGELSLKQRLAVRAHLAMCVRCRRFIRQLRVSQRVIRQLPDADVPELEALLRAMQTQRQRDDHNQVGGNEYRIAHMASHTLGNVTAPRQRIQFKVLNKPIEGNGDGGEDHGRYDTADLRSCPDRPSCSASGPV